MRTTLTEGLPGICEDDAVIIDGAYGAAIRWKAFSRVANLRRVSWKRFSAQVVLMLTGLLFYISLITIAAAPDGSGYAVLVILIPCIIVLAASPRLLRIVFGGKFHATQPWLFGFEGYLDIKTIEYLVFGAKEGRLKWSAWGSPLSRHYRNVHGECIGADPMKFDGIADRVRQAKDARPGESRVSGRCTARIVPRPGQILTTRRYSRSSTQRPWRSCFSMPYDHLLLYSSAVMREGCKERWPCRMTGLPGPVTGRQSSEWILFALTRWDGLDEQS